MSLIHLIVTTEQAELIVTGLLDMPFKQVNQLIHHIVNEIEISGFPERQKKTVTVTPAQTYEYGLNKDGTPKKRPGRPLKKVTS